MKALPWLLAALLVGTTLGAWRLSTQHAGAVVVLRQQRDSLERAIALVETERLQVTAKLRVDSIATAAAAKRVGPVVSRDTVTQTAVIMIDGAPKMAPLPLLEERDRLREENVTLRIDRRLCDDLLEKERARAKTIAAELALEQQANLRSTLVGAAGWVLFILVLL